MRCDLIDKRGICRQAKKLCTVHPDNHKKCNYHIRQHPVDTQVYDRKFKKAFFKALTTRNLNKKDLSIPESYITNYTLSIFQNVKNCMDKLERPEVLFQERRSLTKKELKGNILQSLTSKLYIDVNVRIMERLDKRNSIIVINNGVKYLCKIKDNLSSFFEGLNKSSNKGKYYKSQVIDKRLLT